MMLTYYISVYLSAFYAFISFFFLPFKILIAHRCHTVTTTWHLLMKTIKVKQVGCFFHKLFIISRHRCAG